MSAARRKPGRSRKEIKEQWASEGEKKRLAKICAGMKTFDMLEHLDAAGSGMAKATQDYRKDQDDATPLYEIQRGLREMEAVVHELRLRWEAAHEE